MFESRWVRHFSEMWELSTIQYYITEIIHVLYMRSLAIALVLLLLTCSFAGCTYEQSRGELWVCEQERGGTWDDDTGECSFEEERPEEIREETDEPMTITSEECEERGGTWIEGTGECSFEEERPEEETGPVYIPPCNVIASEGLTPTANPSDWPEMQSGQWLAVDGLTDVSYASIELDSESEVVVDDRLDYECGYTYSVKVPGGYNASDEYPLFLYLHGQLLDSVFFNNMMTNNFYVPDDDKYIIVRPSKLELDWDAKKALDVLEDVKANLNVDDDRVYLTGLSMGGRGTFIVAAALPDYFAAIMPLTPHHEPYSYIPLAEDIAHLPVWMSHGTNDSTSSYDMAAQMAENLTNLGAEIEFQTVVGGEHGGWFAIYSDPEVMQWMLSHTRGQ